MRIIVATIIRHKAVGSDNRGVNVRLKGKKWRNFDNLNLVFTGQKRDYNGGARNFNEYWDAMTHIVCSVM